MLFLLPDNSLTAWLRSAASTKDFLVFGVDATFELGDFYVTLTTSEPFAA